MAKMRWLGEGLIIWVVNVRLQRYNVEKDSRGAEIELGFANVGNA